MRVSCVLSSTLVLLAAQSFVASSPVQADTKPPAAATPAPAKPPAVKPTTPQAVAKPPTVKPTTPQAVAKPSAATPTTPTAPAKPSAATPTTPTAPAKPSAATPTTSPTPAKPPAATPTTPTAPAKPSAATPTPSTAPAKPSAATPPAKPAATPPATPPPAEQTPNDKAEALLDAGRNLIDAHESERAISVLEEAHGVLGTPESGFELMRAYADVGKLVEAINLGEKLATLPPSPKDPSHGVEPQRKIKESLTSLSARVSTIQFQIQRPTKDLIRVKVDETTLLPEQLDKPFRVNAGKHELRVTAPGYEPLTIPKDIDKTTVQQYPVKIDMTPIPGPKDDNMQPPPSQETPDQPLDPIVKVGIGVSSALGAVAIVTGIAAGVSYIGFVDVYNGRGCGAKCDAEVAQRGSTLQGLTLTSTITGVMAVAAGTATLIYARKSPQAPEQASWNVAPTAGGIVIYGRW